MTMPKPPALSSASEPCLKKSGMIETLASSSGSTASTITVCTAPLALSMPCIWVNGATAVTCSWALTFSARARQSSMGWYDSTVACGTMPRMRVRISRSKPFITESTTIITSTPSARPIIEVSEMKETKWLRRLARV